MDEISSHTAYQRRVKIVLD